MQRERVSENVYWFQSDMYAQVSAGVVAGPKWAVVIDTLMPEESLEIRQQITDRRGTARSAPPARRSSAGWTPG